MNVSELLRLLPTTRTGGRLAGQAETGETRVFADPDELLAFLHQIAATPLRDQPIPVVGLPVAATHRRPVTDPPPPLDEAGRAP